MPHIARVQSEELKTRGDKAHAVYAAEGVLDGSSMSFYRDGLRQRIVITDPVFKTALAKLSPEAKNTATAKFVRTLGSITRWFGLSKTVLSPWFHITAYGRDAGAVLVNLQAASRGKLTDQETMYLVPRTLKSMVTFLPKIARGEWDGKTAHFIYKVFKNEGGINPMAHYDLDVISEDLQRRAFNLNSFKSKLYRGVDKTMQLMHFSDNAARMASWYEFLKMKNNGQDFTSEQDLLGFIQRNPEWGDIARDISKNLAGNFEQKGTSNLPRAGFMFWNAMIGGMKTAYNIINPQYGTYGLKSLGLLMMLALLSGIGDDEEDDDGAPLFNRQGEGVSNFVYGGGR